MIPKSASKNCGLESARRARAVIHNFQAVDEITDILKLRNEVHSLSEIKSNSPEIDHVAAFTESTARSTSTALNSRCRSPIGQRRTSNTRSGYEDRFLCHHGAYKPVVFSRNASTHWRLWLDG